MHKSESYDSSIMTIDNHFWFASGFQSVPKSIEDRIEAAEIEKAWQVEDLRRLHLLAPLPGLLPRHTRFLNNEKIRQSEIVDCEAWIAYWEAVLSQFANEKTWNAAAIAVWPHPDRSTSTSFDETDAPYCDTVDAEDGSTIDC